VEIKQEVVSRRLEPLNWRTTQRESRDDYEQRASAGKWGAIATAVINYQNKHKGMSPTDPMIAAQTGWPRHIVVANLAKVQSMTQLGISRPAPKQEEAKVIDTNELNIVPSAKVGSRAAFIERAKQVAQAIVDHYDQHGKPPRMKYIKEQVYGLGSPNGGTGGGLSGVVKKMTELGWLYHQPRCHNDLSLTGLGRAALFGKVDNQLHTDTPINPMERKVASKMIAEPEPIATQPSPQPVQPQPSIPRPVPETRTYRASPDPAAVAMFEDVDLVMELMRRGFKVSR
jgi:hypothetical protein